MKTTKNKDEFKIEWNVSVLMFSICKTRRTKNNNDTEPNKRSRLNTTILYFVGPKLHRSRVQAYLLVHFK